MKIDNRVWLALTVLISAGLLAGGWFVLAQPQIAAAQAADMQRASVVSQNDGIRASLAQLAKAKERMPEIEQELATMKGLVPYTLGGSEFIRNVNDLAAQTGVTVTSITLGTSTPYAPPAAAEGEEGQDAAPTPAVNSLIMPENFVVVDVSVEVSGDYDSTLAFTKALQEGKRLILVDALSLTTEASDSPDAAPGGLTVSLNGNIYVLLPDAQPAAAAPAEQTTEG